MYKNDCQLTCWNHNFDIPINFWTPEYQMNDDRQIAAESWHTTTTYTALTIASCGKIPILYVNSMPMPIVMSCIRTVCLILQVFHVQVGAIQTRPLYTVTLQQSLQEWQDAERYSELRQTVLIRQLISNGRSQVHGATVTEVMRGDDTCEQID